MSTLNSKPMAQFRACWKAGVPLISIDSSDPAATTYRCITSLNGKGNQIPVLAWDRVSGLRGINIPGQPCELGTSAAQTISEGTPGPEALTNPVELLAMTANRAPEESIIFMHGMHAADMTQAAPVAQALWNCRDTCKSKHVTLVLLGPSIKLPAELSQDVMSLSEDLPNDEELSTILDGVFKDAELSLDLLSKTDRERAIDTLRGLNGFCAEQVIATSLTKQGIDFESLWARKVRMIEQTPGLSVWRGKDTLNDVCGVENAKAEMRMLMKGKLNLTCVVFIDEGDKVFAAANTDTSGVSQDANKVLLTYLEDKQQIGCTFHGPPGTCKTQMAKSLAGEFKVPLIMLDLGGAKSKYIGDSEQAIRQDIKIIDAISSGRALWIVAMNGYTESPLPPEMVRRFNYHSFFFDLPSAKELVEIWALWQKKFNLRPEQCDKVNDQGWSGAEVRNCCRKAWAQDITCSQAAMTVIPVSRKNAGMIEAMRKRAANDYVSASYPGAYIYTSQQQPAPAASGRKISI